MKHSKITEKELKRQITDHEISDILSHDHIGDVGTTFETAHTHSSYYANMMAIGDGARDTDPDFYNRHLGAMNMDDDFSDGLI